MSTRRKFLSAALVGLTAKAERRIEGNFVHEAQNVGHMLRDRAPLTLPRETRRVPVVIIGGGMAGLCAAWRLEKKSFKDFVILELDKTAGGNSRYGENEITRYPWAAHYVPVPNREATLVRELLEEFGAMRDGRFEERFLCFSPQERLFVHGRWQESIEPTFNKAEREEWRRFSERVIELRASGDFTIPMDVGLTKAKPPSTRELDQISMAKWLDQNGFRSPGLLWYIDYCCRDDFGSSSAATSAWAGIHYHAAREHEDRGPLTWPEGNGWILSRLLTKLSSYLRTECPVRAIRRDGRKLRVLAGGIGQTPVTEYLADRVIFAAPVFLSRYLIEDAPAFPIEYSPWLTANLTLERLPQSPFDPEVAWDNVIYESPSLGYVSATHMSLRTHQERTVWTYYLALASGTPQENRRKLLTNDWLFWKERILIDLQRAHPQIRECVSRIDMMRMGHAMARPTPGSLFAPWRAELRRLDQPLIYANADVSGFSIFEEAQFRGVRAADAALSRLSRAGS
jgi:phytoene dehydrogenase-like protein